MLLYKTSKKPSIIRAQCCTVPLSLCLLLGARCRRILRDTVCIQQMKERKESRLDKLTEGEETKTERSTLL